MVGMIRAFLLPVAVFVAAIVTAPAASAQPIPIELGVSPGLDVKVASCPPGTPPTLCSIVLTRVTAVPTVRNGIGYPTKVTKGGRIVAFTVGLSGLSTDRKAAHSIIHFLDQKFGGTTHVGITVLKPVGAASRHRWKDAAQSPYIHVQPFLGQVVSFPLASTLPVAPGDVIALSTDTWVPVLTINLSTKQYFYRQDRTSGCVKLPTTDLSQSVGQTKAYLCAYLGTRIEYSATEIANPVAVNPIKGVFRGSATPRGIGDAKAFHGSYSGGAGL
jgi:hypothetical protein